jgi:hypothetical protein
MRHTITFLLVLFVFVAAFLTVEKTSSPFFQSCISEEGGNKGGQDTKEGYAGIGPVIAVYVRCTGRFVEGHGVGITAIATIIIAAFTATLWGATRQQGSLTFESLKLARQEFSATHRPRIVVRFIQGPFDDAIEPQFVWVTVANVGASQATIVAIGSDLARRRGRNNWLPPGVGAGFRDVAPSVLESGDRLILKVKAQEITSALTIFAESVGNNELCVVGQIRYQDANGRKFEMAFLRVHDGEGNFIPSENPEDEYQD